MKRPILSACPANSFVNDHSERALSESLIQSIAIAPQQSINISIVGSEREIPFAGIVLNSPTNNKPANIFIGHLHRAIRVATPTAIAAMPQAGSYSNCKQL